MHRYIFLFDEWSGISRLPSYFLGRFHFLGLSITTLPAYPEALQRVKDGQKMLDLACCVSIVSDTLRTL